MSSDEPTVGGASSPPTGSTDLLLAVSLPLAIIIPLLVAELIIIHVYICYLRRSKLPVLRRRRNEGRTGERIDVMETEQTCSPHDSSNEHSWSIPEQMGMIESLPTTLDVEKGIYNAHSGISALSEEDSSISYPLPTVSSYQGEEDRFLPGDDPGYHEESIAPLAMTAPSISVETAPFTPEENDFNTPYVTQQYSGSSLQERIDVEPPPRANSYGATNLLYETSQSEYSPHIYHDPVTSSLGILSHRSGRPGSNYSVNSEPITSVHSSGRSRQHEKHHSHDNRRHRKHHSPSSQHSHSDHSERLSGSGYHSEYDVNHDRRDYHHHGNNVHGHHDHDHHRRGDRSKSPSRSRSLKVSRSKYHYTSLMAIPTRAGQQYLSHHTLPNSGRTAIPMRASRSDDFVRSGSRGHPFHGAQEPHPPRHSDPTSQWVESTTRQRHASESHPPTHLSSSNQFLPHSSSESDPDQTPPDPPKAPPQIPVGDQKIDNMLLDVVTCLVHQENCRIPRCPCREVKQRFQHLMPQMKEHMAKEAGKVVDDVQSGRFDQMDRRQQMRLSISSQNFSPDIHARYHMTSRSHLRQSDNSRNNRFKLLQRRRSRSMDLTPVMEQPGESCATTPNVMIPDSARGLLCGPAFSPAITPAGETFRVLSTSTPSANQIAPPFILREISLSADNLPALCLNDCPMAVTPLMALGNRPLGSSSPLVTAHQQWFDDNDVVSPLSKKHGEKTRKEHPKSHDHRSSHKTITERGIDPLLCLPDQFTLISTLTCTSDGMRFEDKANDFILEIPKGAIPPESQNLTLDVGVALFGPFQFPEGLRPVSPVFWVCVRHPPDFIFSKPVSLTLPHFLNLENDRDIQSLGLTFLKAGHNHSSNEFLPIEGEMDFTTNKTRGTINVTHFCSLCIAARDIPQCIEKACFCITSVTPKYTVPVGGRADAYFFITFCNINTCLKKVDDIIEKLHMNGSNHEIQRVPFMFNRSTSDDPTLELVITQPLNVSIGIGVSGVKRICRREVDFFIQEKASIDKLEDMQDGNIYPPRFKVFLVPARNNPTLLGGNIHFRGTTNDVSFDTFLAVKEPTISVEVESPTREAPSLHKLDIDKDIPTVKKYLKHLEVDELRDLFQELGLYQPTVSNYTKNKQHTAEQLIRLWILGEDDVLKQSKYSGSTLKDLEKALRELNHHGIADRIKDIII